MKPQGFHGDVAYEKNIYYEMCAKFFLTMAAFSVKNFGCTKRENFWQNKGVLTKMWEHCCHLWEYFFYMWEHCSHMAFSISTCLGLREDYNGGFHMREMAREWTLTRLANDFHKISWWHVIMLRVVRLSFLGPWVRNKTILACVCWIKCSITLACF